MNPAYYVLEPREEDGGEPVARHALPYADTTSLPEERLREWIRERRPLQHSHMLEDQIAGQIDAGFAIVGLYEDSIPGDPVSRFFPPCVATRAVRDGG